MTIPFIFPKIRTKDRLLSIFESSESKKWRLYREEVDPEFDYNGEQDTLTYYHQKANLMKKEVS